MAVKPESVRCSACQGNLFREERILELDNTVMIRKGMTIQAQPLHVSYQYVCIQCQKVIDEEFFRGHIAEN